MVNLISHVAKAACNALCDKGRFLGVQRQGQFISSSMTTKPSEAVNGPMRIQETALKVRD